MEGKIKFKAIRRIAGIIVFAAVIGFLTTSCASLFGGAKNWDNSVPKTEAAVLHFGSASKLVAVDGETKSIGPLAQVYTGNGGLYHPHEGKRSTRDNQAKAILRIPPGQHELTFEFDGALGLTKEEYKITYGFTAGRHYFFAVNADEYVNSGLDGLSLSYTDMPWEIRDVTGEKWAK